MEQHERSRRTSEAVGEVWVCSGQSNMEWSVNAGEDPAKVKEGAKNPNLRLFTVQKKETDQGLLMEARQIRALQLLIAMLNLGENMDQAVDNIERRVAEVACLGPVDDQKSLNRMIRLRADWSGATPAR